jgi:hypothetical protein
MPQVVFLVLGAVGAVLAGKWLVREARRVNAELDRVRAATAQTRSERPSLERDPNTGIYRPRGG